MPELTVTGMDALMRRLQSLAHRAPQRLGAAMRAEAEIEMTEAKKRTPVKTGALRGSGHVTGPEIQGNEITVLYQFGGPSAPYAVEIHENLEMFHPHGQAKFLESVILESAPYMAERIAQRVRVSDLVD